VDKKLNYISPNNIIYKSTKKIILNTMNSQNNTNNGQLNTNAVHRFYIKAAYTDNTFYCPASIHITVAEFIHKVQNAAAQQIYNIPLDSANREELIRYIEVVEAGQAIEGVNSEDAPALQPDDTITMQEKYGDRLNLTAFYVRLAQPQDFV